jgi:hypothetical protein
MVFKRARVRSNHRHGGWQQDVIAAAERDGITRNTTRGEGRREKGEGRSEKREGRR